MEFVRRAGFRARRGSKAPLANVKSAHVPYAVCMGSKRNTIGLVRTELVLKGAGGGVGPEAHGLIPPNAIHYCQS